MGYLHRFISSELALSSLVELLHANGMNIDDDVSAQYVNELAGWLLSEELA
jgi:hypothetical protein